MPIRHNKIILKGFEQHFILLSFLTVVTALVLIIFLVIGLMWIIDPMLLGNATLEDTLYVGAIGFGLLAATYYYTLKVDHRVSGPIFVLMRNLDRMGEGDLTAEMRLRQQDHLQEISDSFNKNLALMCDRVDELKRIAGSIDHSGLDEKNQSLLANLNTGLNHLKTKM